MNKHHEMVSAVARLRGRIGRFEADEILRTIAGTTDVDRVAPEFFGPVIAACEQAAPRWHAR
jgi:hypothetical protein